MKAIVCGAGQVGRHIARFLAAEGNDITVIDIDASLIQKISDTLDVRGIAGFASHPDVLQSAGARDADLLIAVTYSDEVNMVACQVAHTLFDVPMRMARIRQQSYLNPIWSDLFGSAHMPIDAIISPEIEVARAINRRLAVPGAFDAISLSDGKIILIGLRCGEDCPIINTPLHQLTALFPDLLVTVLAIIREGRRMVPHADTQMLAGDEVYFAADSQQIDRAMAAFGHEEPEARRLIIVGGGNIGLSLAHMIEQDHRGADVKLIELDQARSEFVAQQLSATVVINGDALDVEILHEANVKATETVIAVTNDDEVNILSSLLAKKFGAQRAVTLINTSNYAPLMGNLGIDVVVSPRAITASTILQHIRRGRVRSVHSLGDNFGEVIEVEAMETSSLVGPQLRDAKLPEGVIIGALVRDGRVVIPRGDTVIEAHDRVVLFAATAVVKRIEKLLSVRLEYF